MPNWCSNRLNIIGDKEEVNKFAFAVSERTDDGLKYSILHKLVPTPEGLLDHPSGYYTEVPNPAWETLLEEGKISQERYDELVRDNEAGYARDQANLAKYGYKDWYDWNYANWGTKWADEDTHLESAGYLAGKEKHYTLSLEFETPWCAPIAGISKVARQFPNVKFILQYWETSNDFAGCAVFDENGFVEVHEIVPSEINGYKEIDWDAEDYIEVLEQNDELLRGALDSLLSRGLPE